MSGSAQPEEPANDDNNTDWLVGPDEGLAAELARRDHVSKVLQRPALFRPGEQGEPQGAASPPPATPKAPVPLAIPDADRGGGFTRGPEMMWQPPAPSVPKLRREPPVPASAARSRDSVRDFPMDDAEERKRNARQAFAAAEMDATAEAYAAQPHVVVSPDAFAMAAVPVPWWMQVPHVIATDRRIQVLLGVAIASLVTVAFWPRGGAHDVSLSNLRHHSERFDGVSVQVSGQVGQVFQVGQGWAFNLLDGRDTLVVFTRTRQPHERQHLHLRGTMSTGYLDGQPTLALFESTTAAADGK